jgi:hypothetical protein
MKPVRRTALGLAAAAAAWALWAGAAGAQTTIWAVGDGGVKEPTDDAVAARIESEGPFERLLYLGDVYETGTASDFANHYHPSFGRFKERTSPTPGNHEWGNRARGYDPYWGGLAPRQPGGGHYYSFDLGGWHVVSLNSEESIGAGSAQVRWLKRDLAGYNGTCTIAFIHRPRYSAGAYKGAGGGLEPAWATLAGRAVAFLSGHDHNYQRLKPNRGMTQLIVGTGGRHLYAVNESDSLLVASDEDTHGAMRVVLEPGRLEHTFIASDGARGDRGSIPCRPHTGIPKPNVSIFRPSPVTYSRGPRSFAGFAQNADAPVRLTLVRRRGDRCRRFDGAAFRASSCKTSRSFDASGMAPWRFRMPGGGRLTSGGYRLTARVAGAGGKTSQTVRFRVR